MTNQVFHPSRLRADARKIVLCYKIQFKLRRLTNDIVERGVNKYAYVQRARNLLWALLCQAILNDRNVEELAENFGRSLSLEAQYTDTLSFYAFAQNGATVNTLPFTGSTLPGMGDQSLDFTKQFVTSWNHTFSSNVLNELRAGYTRRNLQSTGRPSSTTPPAARMSQSSRSTAWGIRSRTTRHGLLPTCC